MPLISELARHLENTTRTALVTLYLGPYQRGWVAHIEALSRITS